MHRTTIDFGIDLGTTTSAVAVIADADVKVISVMPSAVWIDNRGSVRVGQEARYRALIDDPDNGDLEFKLRMGLGEGGRKRFPRSGQSLLPEELTAEVLKSLRADVQANVGEDVRAAVITVPAAFDHKQMEATREAAHLAGLDSSPLLVDPVAASLAYGFNNERDNAHWLVYDFGGGTFDAAVVRLRNGLIEVVTHRGDNFLGGKDIDLDIVTERLIPAATEQFDLPEFRRGNLRWRNAIGKLAYHAEEAKIGVCRSKAPCDIWIEGLCEDATGQRIDFSYTLTPDDVEQISRPYIERSLQLCRNTLDALGMGSSDMKRILMSGGTTLSPWVREAVQSELGSRVEFGIDPVTVVAKGAAIFAGSQPHPRTDKRDSDLGSQAEWRVEIEHAPVGNISDPDIGGRIVAPTGQSLTGFTIELIDTSTEWRSGRITLSADGVFMTQLYAEKGRRHEYLFELRDATGSRVPTMPDRVSYTLGSIAQDPPAASRIVVGLEDGGVATFVKKGAKLPVRNSMNVYTGIPLRAGHAEDVLRIQLRDGEHARAERNQPIGAVIIRGTDIPRDLPTGNPIEITLFMDQSQQVRVQVYIPALDLVFEPTFDPEVMHSSLVELRGEAQRQKERLTNARENADRLSALQAATAVTRITDQQLVERVDSLIEAAENAPDALAELDRQLRELASAIDDVEDSLEWPLLLERAAWSREDTERVAEEFGATADKNRLRSLTQELGRGIDARDPDLLRRHISDLDGLRFAVLSQQPGFSVAWFNWLVERVQSMSNAGQAKQIIEQARRSINNNDLEALKGANRQLVSLLPMEEGDVPGSSLAGVDASPVAAAQRAKRGEKEFGSGRTQLERLRFASLFQEKVGPVEVGKIIAYAFRDRVEPRQIVLDASRRIEPQGARPIRASASDLIQVASGSRIRVAPEIPGLVFDVAEAMLSLWQDVQSVEFRFRALPEAVGRACNGRVDFWLERVILASLPVTIFVIDHEVPDIFRTALSQVSARPYRSVFPSYSHADEEVVASLEAYAAAFGDEYLTDVRKLRAGQDWRDELRRYIKRADVFQLFWSANAAASKYVTEEWTHALVERSERPDPYFIRPVYWTAQPLPEPPLPLQSIHFTRLRFGG